MRIHVTGLGRAEEGAIGVESAADRAERRARIDHIVQNVKSRTQVVRFGQSIRDVQTLERDTIGETRGRHESRDVAVVALEGAVLLNDRKAAEVLRQNFRT